MTPRPDLSNHAVTLETGDGEFSCMAAPRYLTAPFVLAAIGMLLCLLPMSSIPAAIANYHRRAHADELVTVLLLAIAPFLLALLVLVVVLIRQRRPRGIILRTGQVTLYTPDDTISRHVYELNNVKGAVLVRSRRRGKADLQLMPRRGFTVTVFRSYTYLEVGHVVDLINSYVISDRSFAFEVIPLAKAVTAVQPVAPLRTDSTTPPIP